MLQTTFLEIFDTALQNANIATYYTDVYQMAIRYIDTWSSDAIVDHEWDAILSIQHADLIYSVLSTRPRSGTTLVRTLVYVYLCLRK